jgi:WhiB family redox-sensing transcriptional regulator
MPTRLAFGVLRRRISGVDAGVVRTKPAARTAAVERAGSRQMTWRNRAACLDEDTETFFPLGTTGAAAEQIERAKAVCAACPEVEACLSWALATNQDAGIWGGKTEDERRTIRRRRQRWRKMR